MQAIAPRRAPNRSLADLLGNEAARNPCDDAGCAGNMDEWEDGSVQVVCLEAAW